MTETLSTSKEVPKTRLALEEKYKNEPKESHAKRLDPDNIKDMVKSITRTCWIQTFSFTFYTKREN